MAVARERTGSTLAGALARWATELEPSDEDVKLAGRSLIDTVAVAHAAENHPLIGLFSELGPAGRLAAQAHVLDFDDLHMPSTTHISAICVSVALATHGGAEAYLAGAGVMARLGTALGWSHYTKGWHATCTAGAPAAAATAARAINLDPEQTATALALAIPAAGGVQRAFGTAAKALQVGFAADAGVRAARLAHQGATADPKALEQWMTLVNGDPSKIDTTTEQAVPGGLAIKLFPCCYALQRPLAALQSCKEHLPPPADIDQITITTPESSVKPLIHSRPTTGLEAKFSLEYAVAAYLLDGKADFETFEDGAVNRPEVHRLIERIEIDPAEQGEGEGEGLLAGEIRIEIECGGGETITTELDQPPGAPDRPPTDAELAAKVAMCGADAGQISWAAR